MPELTRAMIDEGMARAEKIACRPGDDRCYAFLDPLEDARKTCTPKGRCRIGWIPANTGRDSWDVWLDVHTGEGWLRRQAHAGRPHSCLKRIRNAGLGSRVAELKPEFSMRYACCTTCATGPHAR